MELDAQTIEIIMIAEDTMFFLDVMSKVMDSPNNGILIHGFMPYLSLFVTESFSYISSKDPTGATELRRNHESIIRTSRNRIKLLDGKSNSVDQFLKLQIEVSQAHHQYFNSGHQGILGRLKRALQNDLGLYGYEDHLICTTHVAQLNSGVDPALLLSQIPGGGTVTDSISHTVGFEIGQYLSALRTIFVETGVAEEHEYCHYGLDDALIWMTDVKSHKYYPSLFDGPKSAAINAALLLIMSTVNFMNDIVSRLVHSNPKTYFKLKYITLYHMAESLKKIQDYSYSNSHLRQRSKDFLAEILSDKNLKRLVSKSKFRNTLVHYCMNSDKQLKGRSDRRLFGLVEYFFDGIQFEELDDIQNFQLLRVAGILDQWMR